MIRATVTFHDGRAPLGVVIGTSEDIAAPRQLKAMESSGWEIDDDFILAFKAWLAAKRQGDTFAKAGFEEWIGNVENIEALPSAKQIEAAVALGTMDREQADKLLAYIGDAQGEAATPPA